MNMRKKWFEFVATVRRRLSRKTKEKVTHRDAMKEAALLWPKEKTKILNRIKREERKALKAQKNQSKEEPAVVADKK